MTDFGRRIRMLRQQYAMTVSELAVKSGIASYNLIAIEDRRRFPSLGEIERLLRALDVDWKVLDSMDT